MTTLYGIFIAEQNKLFLQSATNFTEVGDVPDLADFITGGLASLEPLADQFASKWGAAAGGTAAANRIAFRDGFAAGQKTIRLVAGNHAVEVIPGTEAVKNNTAGQQPSVIIPEGFRMLDGGGATLQFTGGRGIMHAPNRTWAYPVVMSYVAADIAAGDTSVTLEAGQGANWSVGDQVLWRLGSVAGDLPETYNWGFAKVKSKVGDVLTLDRPMPEAFAVASVAGQSFVDGFGNTVFNKAFYKHPASEGFEIRDLTIEGDTNLANVTETAIKIMYARNQTLRRFNTRRVSTGVSIQYSEGVLIEDCLFENNNWHAQSAGKGISLGETRNVVIRDCTFRSVPIAFSLEAAAEAYADNILIDRSDIIAGTAYSGTENPFIVGNRSRLTVRNCTITGRGGYSLVALGSSSRDTGGTIRFEGRLTLIHPTAPTIIWAEALDCMLEYRIAGGYELWDFRNTKTWRGRLNLRDGTTHTLRGPKGQPKAVRVYASSGLTLGAGNMVTSFLLGHPTFAGSNFITQLEAGKTVLLDQLSIGSTDSSLWANRGEQMQVRAVTAAGMGLDANDEFIDFEIDYAVNLLDTDTTWSSEEHVRRTGTEDTLREALFAAYDLPSIAAGATLTVDFSIPGMAAGDIVEGVAMALLYAGLEIQSMEARADQARVIIKNTSGSAIDRAAQNITVQWRRTSKG